MSNSVAHGIFSDVAIGRAMSVGQSDTLGPD